jgi:hypothetical protein
VTPYSGDLIMDIAHEVEDATKAEALSRAQVSADNIEVEFLRVGGYLKRINDNTWWSKFASFDVFVFEQFGFKLRKAQYLIATYDHLVTKQIPWSKVQHLGWSKVKMLAPTLTLENVDRWVAKAGPLSVLELQGALNPPVEYVPRNAKTTKETIRWAVDLRPDQLDNVTQAMYLMKGVLRIEADSVVLDILCAMVRTAYDPEYRTTGATVTGCHANPPIRALLGPSLMPFDKNEEAA